LFLFLLLYITNSFTPYCTFIHNTSIVISILFFFLLGFKLAGLVPFDIREIFKQGTSWGQVSEENAIRIIDTIPRLAHEVRISNDGACSDALITSMLGDIITTPIVGLDSKVLNQKRAVWLTPEKARYIKAENSKKIETERLAALEKAEKKAAAALAKRTTASLAAQVAGGLFDGRKENLSSDVSCNNECGNVRKGVLEGVVTAYDGWLGCLTCPNWFCGKVNCQKRFKKHYVHCHSLR
jgi:hypothetical protein